jgi:hypothetical protein
MTGSLRLRELRGLAVKEQDLAMGIPGSVAVLSRPSPLAAKMAGLLTSTLKDAGQDEVALRSFDLLRDSSNPALEDCDAILLMCAANVDAVYASTVALDSLRARFDPNRITVVVMEQRGADAEAVARQLSRRATQVRVIPFDGQVSSLEKATIADLQPATRSAYMQLAADIVEQIEKPRIFATR